MSDSSMSDSGDNSVKESYWSLFWTFLKIGSTAFGGFMALISVVQNYVVERRKSLSSDEMLDGISLATILPGPIAFNVVAYVGYKLRGLWGALVCTFAVTLPSFVLILGLSYAYFTFGEIPAVSNIFSGFLPAVAAIIIAATFNMGQKVLIGNVEYAIALVAMFALLGIGGFYSTLIILAVSGVLGYLLFYKRDQQEKENTQQSNRFIPKSLMSLSAASVITLLVALVQSKAFILAKLFSTFATMSLLLFGGGFVFIPLIQEVVVDSYSWVTQKEFIDAIALGQVTPGPILISATFIGYKVAGLAGATVATLGIFAPPAVLMLVCTVFLDKLKNSASIKATLKGVRCGVIGLIAAAAYVVLESAEPNFTTLIIFAFSLIALLFYKLEVAWVIPIAGTLGYLLY